MRRTRLIAAAATLFVVAGAAAGTAAAAADGGSGVGHGATAGVHSSGKGEDARVGGLGSPDCPVVVIHPGAKDQDFPGCMITLPQDNSGGRAPALSFGSADLGEALGIDAGRASILWAELTKACNDGGTVDVTCSAFDGYAAEAGVSPQRLADAVAALEQNAGHGKGHGKAAAGGKAPVAR